MSAPLDTEQALSDLQAIVELWPQHNDLLETLCRVINEGTAILQIDRSHTPGAGKGVVRYKLADMIASSS
jgi:hypothetical protein